ncbi:MAG TPA: hypothetical protein VJS38_19010 [Phenylobacterium sp.]|uniref:hypothetical protein n=1 Tax=Phenylobacterium sp. TaxID=1871053 RepID=UPI002B4AAB6B|nr:hypothetical protein [Phenylobacterium sp.]HKR90264.1 hypothetical protein [Phenylobacterium sp.]HKT54751.1 hypothetical protein [Caulobacteraceae bacterium]
MTDRAAPTSAEEPAPTTVVALVMLIFTIAACGGYIALNVVAGSQESYAGFFFLLFWGGLQKSDLRLLPGTVMGSFAGLALGLLMHQLQQRFGDPGLVGFLAVLLTVLFLYFRQKLRLVLNEATMLMMTLSTVLHVQAHASFQGLFISLAIAVVFFGAILWAVVRLRPPAPQPAPAA